MVQVGPGKYTPTDNKFIFKNGPSWNKFPRFIEKNSSEIEKNFSPGPGSYEISPKSIDKSKSIKNIPLKNRKINSNHNEKSINPSKDF